MRLPSTDTKIKCFRIFSFLLLGGAVLLFFFDKWMAVFSLIEALLFLLIYCGFLRPWESPILFALPGVPMILYDLWRVFLFLKAGLKTKYDVWYTLEVLLLAVAYTFAVVYFLTGFRYRWMRITCFVLFSLCILLGIWDILDGTWVLFNRKSLTLEYRIKHYFFYYIPDIFFWIFPFVMLGSAAYHKIIYRA